VDVSLRTPHGTADVQIVVSPPTATLRDLIAAITDQSAPGVVSVDGHAVETSTTLADGVVLWGSVIDSNPHALEPAIATSAALAQIAGPGAGRSHPLTPGRYRVGPGRRSNAEELDAAPVLETVMELVADAEGGISVEATGPAEVTLEGSTVQSSTNWSDGQIAIVGRRAFTIDRRPPQARRAGPPASFGTVLFSRPPRRPATMRLPVVEAVREAAEALPSLWERRLDQPDALSLCVGIAVEGGRPGRPSRHGRSGRAPSRVDRGAGAQCARPGADRRGGDGARPRRSRRRDRHDAPIGSLVGTGSNGSLTFVSVVAAVSSMIRSRCPTGRATRSTGNARRRRMVGRPRDARRGRRPGTLATTREPAPHARLVSACSSPSADDL
jgi:hypothetical protein